MADRIEFRPGEPLSRLLAERSDGRSDALTARRDLLRYYMLVAYELRAVELDEAEALLVCEALSGVWMSDEWSPAYIGAEVADAIRLNRLDEKWEVDGRALAAKAMGWTFGQRYAVADAVERWWSPAAAKSEPDDRKRLRLVGLVRDPVDSMRWRP